MTLEQFLVKLQQEPTNVQFEDTMAVIDANFEFEPTAFINGNTKNEANQNNGSCKIFAFGLEQSLNAEQTLACFGRFYREDVLQNPENDDHQNIRNFMVTGWEGIKFDASALKKK
ncbi:HopJ type III effector protein [Vibrio mexicanus]|uniref:HopJ type III effector protein n=1 Tax=Vibrio mexicanus TaxID=1004326 RepID=UPI00063C1DAE|nr:HopJ type III effector protein [Vibrio mexicanus]